MRTGWRGGLVPVLLLVAACTSGPVRSGAPAGPDRIVSVPAGPATSLGYEVRLPPGYAEHPHATVPTLVFLHGYGERGDGSPAALPLLMTAALPALVQTHELPAAARSMLILMPQTPAEQWDPATLHQWLAQVLPAYRVDRDRLYLTGISMGGGGAIGYLATYGAEHQFAAVASIAEDWTWQPAPLGLPPCAPMRSTPLWAFHGSLDATVPPQLSVNLVSYLNGHCHEAEPARLTLYKSTFHDAWDITYDLRGMDRGYTVDGSDPYSTDVYTWFLRHSRS